MTSAENINSLVSTPELPSEYQEVTDDSLPSNSGLVLYREQNFTSITTRCG
jgi:hypothetical protein